MTDPAAFDRWWHDNWPAATPQNESFTEAKRCAFLVWQAASQNAASQVAQEPVAWTAPHGLQVVKTKPLLPVDAYLSHVRTTVFSVPLYATPEPVPLRAEHPGVAHMLKLFDAIMVGRLDNGPSIQLRALIENLSRGAAPIAAPAGWKEKPDAIQDQGTTTE